jgi:excisionase family DNA binding protein
VDDMSRYVTLVEAAKIKNVTRQAVYLAISEGKLDAMRIGRNWMVLVSDLEKYDRSRWCRKKSKYDGNPIFNPSKGIIDVKTAASLVKVDEQKIYYAMRTGKLRAVRKNAAWVIDVRDLMKYSKVHLNKNLSLSMIA